MTATHKAALTSFSTPSDREILITRVVEAPRTLVWEVHTNPVHVPRWMLGPPGWTMPICEIDLRPGGAWRFVWRHADGSEMEMHGVYREIQPPERLVNTESWGAGWAATINTLLLSEEDRKTTITSRVLYPSKQTRDAALESGMREGMSTSFERLAEYLSALSEGA